MLSAKHGTPGIRRLRLEVVIVRVHTKIIDRRGPELTTQGDRHSSDPLNPLAVG
jgi:hypothetical protein